MDSQGLQRGRADGRPERGDLLREAAAMVLYVSVIEIAELAALPERHRTDCRDGADEYLGGAQHGE